MKILVGVFLRCTITNNNKIGTIFTNFQAHTAEIKKRDTLQYYHRAITPPGYGERRSNKRGVSTASLEISSQDAPWTHCSLCR